MDKPRILAFSGSARKASWNTMLLNVAVGGARAAGADVTLISLRDYPMPIYDGDFEASDGMPPAALALRELLLGHQGFLVASPEYNGSVSALLKNSLDWCSRPAAGQDGLAPYRGKTVALLAASIGPFGGVRSLSHLRGIFSKMGANVLADEVMVPTAQQAFTPEGGLASEVLQKMALQQGASLAAAVARHNSRAPA